MKIVKLKGGLGNQMFQYSYAKLLEKMTGEQIKLDFSAYDSLNESVRVPRLKRFRLSLKTATDEEIKQSCIFKHKGNSLSFWYKVKIFFEKTFNSRYFFEPNRAWIEPSLIKEFSYFDGYWQSYKYVEEVKKEILDDFVENYELSEKTKSFLDKISDENAVFVGIRKGDYTQSKKAINHYGSFDFEYYQRAMDIISKNVQNPVFYIFTNDIEWCKKNLPFKGENILYREKEDQTDDFEELMIMTACKHAIIVNSTYHWWGAYLIKNVDKLVICPKKWFFDDKPIDIIPDAWIRN